MYCFIEALVPWPLHYYIIKLQIPLQWNVYSVGALPAPHIFQWPVRVSVRMRGDDYLQSAGPCMCMNTEITLEITDESLWSNLNEYLEVYMERKRHLSFCHGMPYTAAQPLWWMCTHLVLTCYLEPFNLPVGYKNARWLIDTHKVRSATLLMCTGS